jgi:hypothetical protein
MRLERQWLIRVLGPRNVQRQQGRSEFPGQGGGLEFGLTGATSGV